MTDTRYRPGQMALERAAAVTLSYKHPDCPCPECENLQWAHDQIRALPSGDWESVEAAVESAINAVGSIELSFNTVLVIKRSDVAAMVRAVLAGPGGER